MRTNDALESEAKLHMRPPRVGLAFAAATGVAEEETANEAEDDEAGREEEGAG